MTKITDLPGAKEAFPRSAINNVYRITHHDITNVHLEVDVEAMVDLIAKYHFELGLRIKSGSKEVVSPSRELAKSISDNIPKWARLVRK